MKKTLLIVALSAIAFAGYSQRLHKFEAINELTLTLDPTIFDPNQDPTIERVEFWQDTTVANYEEKTYASVGKNEKIEQVYGIGFIRDYRVGKKNIAVIIKTYHTNGEVKTTRYEEKIDNLKFYNDFDWALYSVDVEIFYEGEEDEVHSL